MSKGLRRALNADHAVGVSGATAQFSWQVSGMSNQKLVSLFNNREIAISWNIVDVRPGISVLQPQKA